MTEAYQVALLHTKAYRVLRQEIASLLSPFAVTMLEWVLLCSLDLEEGLRLAQVADYIGVEAPLISQLIRSLQEKGLVKLSPDKEDRRAKRLVLTVNGLKLVTDTNQQLEGELSLCLSGLSEGDISTHLRALETIIHHDD